MAIAKSAVILILCFALANYAVAAPREKQVGSPDIFMGKNVAQDVLLPGEKLVDVTSFGAKPDGETDSTQAFMDAWQTTCHVNKEQSRMYVPAGRFLVSPIIFAGPCLSPNPITIQVIGTVLASTDISEYTEGTWLQFEHIDGLKIIGGGTFDGQGKDSWQFVEDCEKRTQTCVRNPSGLHFEHVRNALIQGVKSVNPKGFHVFVTNCANFRLRRLKLLAPETSPNTDGIHISHSINVKLSRNVIATGDDCVSIIQGAYNVTINKLKCGPGHGISIGSLGKFPDELEVKGIIVKNCTMIGTTNGLRIKSWPDLYPGGASDISFTDIIMENVKNPVIIDQEYECYPNCQKKPSLVKIANVHFANIRGTTISPVAVDLRCSQLNPCQGVTIQNINLKLAGGIPTTSRCQFARPIFGGILFPPACSL
ncbi:PREDICTED: exopolygalacturonase-like [Lupinus angustifolius]|uniref:exopolygalacturonase-like n=1 Tax=Lupinus angustifolius TaxID=3871 RepID=UPI00092EDB26|nr:PREDICTED: exopolygalacturonase-like [Lupinus angustifolius]